MRRFSWEHPKLALVVFWGAFAYAAVAHAADGGTGIACPLGNECGDAGVLTCIDGYCCNDPTCGSNACAACNGGERGWAGAVNGICTMAPIRAEPRAGCPLVCDGLRRSCPPGGCATSSACAGGFYCNPQEACVMRLAQGAPCAIECAATGICDACPSGYCADRVCCDMACDGACEACTSVLKGGASTDGLCGSVPPDGEPVARANQSEKCTPDQPCGKTGKCDGAGQCANHLEGDTCIVSEPGVYLVWTCNAQLLCVARNPCSADGGCSDAACSNARCDDAAAPGDSTPGNGNRCQGPECPDASICIGACADASTDVASDGAAGDLPRCQDEHTLTTASGPRECPAFSVCRMGTCGQPCGDSFCPAPEVCLLTQRCGMPDADQPPTASCTLARVGSSNTPSGSRWSLAALELLAAAWRWRQRRAAAELK